MKIIPIGFTGHRNNSNGLYVNNNNVGKDTACDMLFEHLVCQPEKEFGLTTVFRMNLADPVRETVMAKFGIPATSFSRENKEIQNVSAGDGMYSPRQLLQLEGTNHGRQFYGDNIWIDTLKNKLKNLCNADKCYVIIGDVRFENEANWIREEGLLVHISRIDPTQDHITFVDEDKLHPAERKVHMDLVEDYILENNGTLEDLRLETQSLVTPKILQL